MATSKRVRSHSFNEKGLSYNLGTDNENEDESVDYTKSALYIHYKRENMLRKNKPGSLASEYAKARGNSTEAILNRYKNMALKSLVKLNESNIQNLKDMIGIVSGSKRISEKLFKNFSNAIQNWAQTDALNPVRDGAQTTLEDLKNSILNLKKLKSDSDPAAFADLKKIFSIFTLLAESFYGKNGNVLWTILNNIIAASTSRDLKSAITATRFSSTDIDEGVKLLEQIQKQVEKIDANKSNAFIEMFTKDGASTTWFNNILSKYVGEPIVAMAFQNVLGSLSATVTGSDTVASGIIGGKNRNGVQTVENKKAFQKTDINVQIPIYKDSNGNFVVGLTSTKFNSLELSVGISVKTYTRRFSQGTFVGTVELGKNGTIGNAIYLVFKNQSSLYKAFNTARWAFDTEDNGLRKAEDCLSLIDVLTRKMLYWNLVTRSGTADDFAFFLSVNNQLYSTYDILKDALNYKGRYQTNSVANPNQIVSMSLDVKGRQLLNTFAKWVKPNPTNTEAAKQRSKNTLTVIEKQMHYSMNLYLNRWMESKKSKKKTT